MGKEKRKTRLNKGESGDFIGFGAFAAPAAAPIASDTFQKSTTSPASSPSLTLSPVYLGSDASLSILFPRIGQKRDATTKTKALLELKDFFADASHAKKSQVDALAHFLYLFHSKLYYDSTASVRAASLECCAQASKRVPKAWKTLTTQDQQPEILGMIFCARADQAADVRLAAKNAADVILLKNNDDREQLESIHMGLWDFCQRILSYGKAMAMHEDLFQKSKESGLSERQKEELEERYERILGTTLLGVRLFLLDSTTTLDASNQFLPEDLKFLWKTLASPKSAIRLKTYSLLSAACQKIPNSINIDKISKLLSQCLSSEKEASNVPALLETLLSFISQSPPDQRTERIATYTKPLTKLFKKGCYGATGWAPTVLPIVALLPVDDRPGMLATVWEGRTYLVGVADRTEVVQAVAETATFLLQQPRSDLAEVTAKCWLRSLEEGYLSASSSSNNSAGPALRAQKALGKALAKDIGQLNQATDQKPNSSICHLKDWFWNEELPKCLLKTESQNSKLAAILSDLKGASTATAAAASDRRPHYALALTQKFQSLLTKCQGSSGLVPTTDVYELWIAILKHVPITDLLTENLEHFVLNDLLRWMVIHTSSLSEQAGEVLTKLDFRLFWHCTSVACDNFESLWTSVLRELIAAKCDLQYLSAGLVTLTEQGFTQNQLQSSVLDELCIQVAKEAVEPHPLSTHDDDDDGAGESISHASTEVHMEYHRKTSEFLQTCCGLGEIDDSLIGSATVDTWVELACPNDALKAMEFSPVLETLVSLARNDKLAENSLQKTIVQCWRQGGDIWQNETQSWLETKPDFATQFITLASKESNSIIRQISSEAKFNSHLPTEWAARAFRLLEFCHGGSVKASTPSLSMVGLADITLWGRKEGDGDKSFVAKCLLGLMSLVDQDEKRCLLISQSEVDDSDALVVQILMSLSDASTDVVNASPSRRRRDACALLLTNLAGSTLDFDLVEKWCQKCISILSSSMRDKASQERVCRGIAVLSQLLELGIRRLHPSLTVTGSDDTIDADQVNKGDSLWYITNAENPSKREPCKVVKIHSDLPEELYFTIATNRDGESQERQTVLARLRQNEHPPAPISGPVVSDDLISIDAITTEDLLRREKLSNLVFGELVQPFWDAWSDLDFELLNILISHIGLLGDRGVGTLHFAVIQRLTSLQSSLHGFLATASEKKEEIVSTLWQLSVALGFGVNTPPSRGAIAICGFSPSDSLQAIVDYYGTNEAGEDSDLDKAVAVWLSVAGRGIENADLRDRVHALMFRIAAHVFESCQDDETFVSGDLIAVRTMYAAQNQSHETDPGQSVVQDDEAEAIKEMVSAFASRWEDSVANMDFEADHHDAADEPPHQPLWSSLPVVKSVLGSSFKRRSALVAAAARSSIDSIISSLGHDSKRFIALRLIQAYSHEGIPLHDDPDESINESTANRLPEWSKGLVIEEAEELEEDVGLVAQWIPKQLMVEVEHWHEDHAVADERDAFGRMALWLAFLDIADVAARKGTLIRPALTSYIRYSKSADAILDLAVAYGNVGSDGKLKLGTTVASIEKLFQAEKSMMELVKMAADTVVFRTVEVLPTVSKTWWEVTCSSYCSQAVKDFVESTVSPQILRHELDRMKRYTAFGEMTVRGSAVSREITALYKQDDFTLTVIIRLPPSFPFGRAEVDCSKTLGVPEQRSKRWSLQISLMLNNQGGTLIDALILWKENVDKEFEGVEPCPVCYSVLHVKTHKLPEMQCKTCSNRFHFDCLTQWFRSSGKSACVLCQQPWSGTRVT